MKRITITLIMILFFATPAHAGSWDKTNTKLHVPLTLLMIADMHQTLYMVSNQDIYHETKTGTNDYLGTYPSKNDVYEYFAISYLINTFIPYALPTPWSHRVQLVLITERAYYVNNNYQLGIKFSF